MSMASKKKTTARKTKVIGTQEYINKEDGSVEEFNVVKMEDRDFNFTKIWIGHIISALDAVGNQKIKVVTFLLENMTNDNLLIFKQAEIAKKAKVSIQTVSSTMKLLMEANIIKKKSPGLYVFNPNCIFKGSHKKRMNVLLQYEQIDKDQSQESKPKHAFDVIEGGRKEEE